MTTRPRLRAERAFSEYTRKHAPQPLTAQLGNNAGLVDHPTRGKGWIYARLLSDPSRLIVASDEGNTVPHEAGIVVQVEWKRAGYYQVLQVMPGLYPDNVWADTVGAHAAQHQRRDLGGGGFDPVDVYTRALVNLRARAQATPDLTLHVERGFVPGATLQEFAGGESPGFTAVSMPPYSANVRWDLLYLWMAPLSLQIVEGAEVGSETAPDDVPKPACPAGSYPLAYVWRYSAQTALTENCIWDARPLGSAIGALPTSTPAASTVYYVHNEASDVNPAYYQAKQTAPDGTEGSVVPSVPAANAFRAITNAGDPGSTVYPAGTTTFKVWASIHIVSGAPAWTFYWQVQVSLLHLDDTVTTLGTGYSPNIYIGGTDLAPTEFTVQVEIPATAMAVTDRLMFDAQALPAPGAAGIVDVTFYCDGSTKQTRYFTSAGGAVSSHHATHEPGGSDALAFSLLFPGIANPVRDYGAVGDGTSDDYVPFFNAISHLITVGGGVLEVPAGYQFKIGTALPAFTAPISARGEGNAMEYDDPTTSLSRILFPLGTGSLFTVSSYGCSFRGFTLHNTFGGTPSSGAGITVTAGGDGMQFENLTVWGFYIGIDIQDGFQWKMDGCYLAAAVKYALKIRHIDLPDGGDQAITNSWFLPGGRDADAAIRVESAGGLKITNCKINGWIVSPPTGHAFVHGIDLAIPNGITTTDLLVSNSSIENVTGDGIHIATSGTGSWGLILLTGIQFALYGNTTGHAISISANTLGEIVGVTIGNCVFLAQPGSTASAIDLNKVDHVYITNNALLNFASLLTQSGCTNVVLPTTVSSVGLSMPAQFSVTGSPVTGAGTLVAAWADQAANRVLAGPVSGGDAAPTMRKLVAADVGTGTPTGAKFLRDDMAWVPVSTVAGQLLVDDGAVYLMDDSGELLQEG